MKLLRILNSVLLLIASAEWVSAEVTITQQPTNMTVSVGADVRFKVTVAYTGLDTTYQWRFNETALDPVNYQSATTPALALTSVTVAQAGTYDVVITDPSGSVTSQAAILTVDPTFTKITQGAPATDTAGSTSATWVDYDQDGHLDLFVGNAGNQVSNLLYHNNGDGSFTRVTNVVSTTRGNAWGVTWGDYDNDGNVDLFVGNVSGYNDFLFRNQGNGQFSRVTSSPVVNDRRDSIMPFWGDANSDGLIDLFVAMGGYSGPQNDRLYLNQGGGVFEIATSSEVGEVVADGARTQGLGWVDYDNDNDLDLFVAYMEWVIDINTTRLVLATNFVFRSSPTGPFEKVALPTFDSAGLCWGVAWGDYDNDGYSDVFLPAGYGTNALFKNLQGQGFSDVSETAGLRTAMSSFASAWGDYDNDGWLDLFVANYTAAARYPGGNALFRNNHDGTFTRVIAGSVSYEGGLAVGAAWGDYDNDGFLDLYVANGDGTPERNLFYRNNGNGNRWLKVQLRGTASNGLGIGAKVRVRAKVGGQDLWQMRPISGQHSHVSDNGLIAHFGLGDATNVDLVRIEWPSGNVQERADVAANQLLTIRENVLITPANPTVSLNGSVTLTRASAGPDASYQWQFNGTPLVGATLSTLTLDGVQASQEGRYSVIVTTADQGVVTNQVFLDVDSTFTKVTTGPLVSPLGNCGSLAWGDFNSDSYPDAFVACYKKGPCTLYYNNRDGTFTAAAGPPSQTTDDAWTGGTAADFNNDGKLDLYLPRESKSGFFYFNNGDGTFTASEFHGGSPWNVAAADYDRDGLLDLFVSNAGRLYRNGGDRTFARAGTYGSGMYGGAAWGDYDDDGWPDLFCGGNTHLARLFRNDGAGGFVPVSNAVTRGLAFVGAWGDYDNDGRLDVCSTPFGGTVQVYRNLGDGEFEQADIGQTISGTYNGVCWADYDNDGFLDLFLTTGKGVPNRLYRSNGDGTFTRVQSGSLVTELPTGGTALWSFFPSWFDYDNDGFLDLYVPNGSETGTAQSAPFLYHNNGNENAWLKVKLVGTASNHDGVGAKVRAVALYAGQARWQRRDISAGDVANGGNLIAHFGLGDATKVPTLKIEWPSGAVQVLANVAPRQFLTVWEPPAIKAAVGESGGCVLTITAEPNRTWRIEGSEDLETWQVVATVTNPTPTFGYTDSASAAMICRFYRVVAE
ncbi:MAG: FG-GAP-like repeat-containing protein [Verrucomicrobiia bacterium]